MTEETEDMKMRIHKGLNMVMDKAEKIGREKMMWSLVDLSEMADVMKDCAKAYSCLEKHHEEVSTEQY